MIYMISDLYDMWSVWGKDIISLHPQNLLHLYDIIYVTKRRPYDALFDTYET